LICIPGFLAKLWIVSKTRQRLYALVMIGESEELVSGVRHVFFNQILRLISWSMFVAMGLIAAVNEPAPTNAPVGQTAAGQVVVILLIMSVGVLSAQTINDWWFIFKQDRKSRLRHPRRAAAPPEKRP
jgi:hypothetical protein